MKDTAFKLSVCAVLVFVVSIVMASSVLARDTSCKTKYPIILAHGMGFTPTATMPHSFPGIVEALRACGATVYYTTVPALHTNAVKSAAFKKQFEAIRATDGSAKFNIMGHSQGGLYTRYAISNLGLAPYVASLTTAASPHRGSFIDSVLLTITDVFPTLKPLMANFAMFPGDQTYAEANERELTVDYMTKVFNPNTPNMKGVYYQSFAVAYRKYDIIRTTADQLAMFTKILLGNQKEPTVDEAALALYDMMKDTATMSYYMGGGIGDGLVQESSAKWGTYLGCERGPIFSNGVNHLDAVNMQLRGQVWDAKAYWVNLAKKLKAKGY
jgi:triacylglycerol lipase